MSRAGSRGRTSACLVSFVLAAASCSSADLSATVDTAASETSAPADGPVATDDADAPSANRPVGSNLALQTAYGSGSSDHIYDQSLVHTFELTLSDDALAFLDADPAAEEWVTGSLTFDGETLDGVGIRYKGSIGAFVGCLSNPDFSRPSGSKTCTKLSMKVKVDRDADGVDHRDRTFYGLRRLQFHSMNGDASAFHERLGYHLFGASGVATPRSTHARLMVNGEFVGLFALTEEIDGRFAADRFEDGGGNIYKEVWPVTGSGDAPDDDEVVDALRTNTDDADVSFFARTAAALATGGRAEREAIVAETMDVERLITMMVVDRAIANDDGALHWYCRGMSPSSCSNHNYYWYEEPAAARLHLVPWDLDNAFENLPDDRNPVTPIADDWAVVSNGCEPFRHGGFFLYQRSATCDPLTAVLAERTDLWTSAVRTFLDGPFSAEAVDQLLDEWSEQIAPHIAEAASRHDDAPSVDEWNQAVLRLRDGIEHSRARLEASLTDPDAG